MPDHDPSRTRPPAGRPRPAAAAVWFALWLLLSAAVHALGVGLLFLVAPRHPGAPPTTAGVALYLPEPGPAALAPPPPLPPPVPEPAIPAARPPLPETGPPDRAASEGEAGFDLPGNAAGRESAFEGAHTNPVIGLGGNAGGRFGGRRERRAALLAQSRATVKAIDDGLHWLVLHQDDDGRFDADGFMKHDTAGAPCDGPGNPVHDVGVTALALLAFLGDGSTLRVGPHREPIRKAVRWLRDRQQESGLFGSKTSDDFIYGHAIAALAMCEAYGLSQYTILAEPAQRGIDYLFLHRNPEKAWRYLPQAADSDASITGWCLLACESARQFQLRVDATAIAQSARWLEEVTDAQGRTGYQHKGEPSSRHGGDHQLLFPPSKGEALTASALFCRFFLGQDPREHPVMQKAADLLLQKPPLWDPRTGTIDCYYWFFGTQAMYQMGGHHWSEWSRRLGEAVLKNQRTDGNFAGSWDPIDAWGQDGGRVYATAILVLTLQTHCRYARLLPR